MQGSAPVKYFVTLICSNKDLREHSIHILSDKLGEVDYMSEWYPFAHTSYYQSEMGHNLVRSFVSFTDLHPPEELSKIKLTTIACEDKFREDGKRRVNIDPGYIDLTKVVLASGKYSAYRIAVSKGCYADFCMYYDKRGFVPLPWCFPDFAKGTYNGALKEIRKLFKENRPKA